jgi:hypothetical protein
MPTTQNSPNSETLAQQFSGLITEVADTAVPVGAMVAQVNLTCEERGVLTTRPGLKPVSFQDD